MLVEIIHVEVTTQSTRTFDVPAYEVPIIRALWDEEIRKGAHLGWKITEFPTGTWEPRQLYEETNRLRVAYNTDGGNGRPIWQDFYPLPRDLHAAWQKAVDDCAAMIARQKAAADQAAKPQAAEDDEAEDEAPAATAPAGKAKRGPKPKAKPQPQQAAELEVSA